MILPDVEPWQVPLIVTGAVVLGEVVVSVVAKRFRPRFPAQWKTGLLVLLGVGGLFFASVTALGASMADHLSSTAGGIATLASVWLAYRAYYSSRERPKAGVDEPAPPVKTPSAEASSPTAPPLEASPPEASPPEASPPAAQSPAAQSPAAPSPEAPPSQPPSSQRDPQPPRPKPAEGLFAEWKRSRRKTRDRT